MPKTHVLFVCLGNICRSPLGEGIMRSLVERRGLSDKIEVDSCGTGAWHVGEPPHPDSRRTASENGVSLKGQRARQLKNKDFAAFDYILCLDESNYEDVMARGGKKHPRVHLLREWDPKGKSNLNVPDPYYEGGFQNVFDIIYRSCERLLDDIEKEIS